MADEWSRNGPGGPQSPAPETVRLETPNGSDVSSTVVLAVEELTGTPVEELPPLGRRIDADALDRLFRPRSPEDPDAVDGAVQFRYTGCTVTVDSEGTVVVRHATEQEPGDAP